MVGQCYLQSSMHVFREAWVGWYAWYKYVTKQIHVDYCYRAVIFNSFANMDRFKCIKFEKFIGCKNVKRAMNFLNETLFCRIWSPILHFNFWSETHGALYFILWWLEHQTDPSMILFLILLVQASDTDHCNHWNSLSLLLSTSIAFDPLRGHSQSWNFVSPNILA